MELRVIDFEILTRSFQPYVDGYLEIESEKRRMIESIDPDRKEMESILARSNSGIIVDEINQRMDAEKFKKIQEKLMRLDSEFKAKLKSMNDLLTQEVFGKLSEIVNDWAIEKSIDMVVGKMEVIYNVERLDVTSEIIEIIKERGQFYSKEEPILSKA